MRFSGNVRFFGNSILFNSYHRLRQIFKGNVRAVHIQSAWGVSAHSIGNMVEYFYFKETFYKKIRIFPPFGLCRKNDRSLSVVRYSIS